LIKTYIFVDALYYKIFLTN